MQHDLESKVTVKLFAGCCLNSEIRMLLYQSKVWKQASISPTLKMGEELAEVHFNGKDYLGWFLPSEKITLVQLKEIESQARRRLQSYCPALDAEDVKMCIFPQVFVA